MKFERDGIEVEIQKLGVFMPQHVHDQIMKENSILKNLNDIQARQLKAYQKAISQLPKKHRKAVLQAYMNIMGWA